MGSVRFSVKLPNEVCIISSKLGITYADLNPPEDVLCLLCTTFIVRDELESAVSYIHQVSDPALLPKYLVSSCKILRIETNKRLEELS